MRRAVRFAARDGVRSFAALLVVILTMHSALSGRWWVWNIVAIVPPAVIVILPLLTILCGLRRRSWGAVAFAAMALPIALTQSDITLPAQRPPTHPDVGIDLVVFSWNTRYWDTEPDSDFYAFLQRQAADIYQLQEDWMRDGTVLNRDAQIRTAFPGYSIARSGDLVTLSRFPITEYTTERDKHYLRVDIAPAPGQRLSFYNVHLPIPVGRDLHDMFRRRAAALAALESDISSNTRVEYVSGDFNSTTAMGVIGWFRRRFTDSAIAGNTLFPRTWAPGARTWLKLWRLDFNFVDPRLNLISHEDIDPGSRSDHSGQRVTVGF